MSPISRRNILKGLGAGAGLAAGLPAQASRAAGKDAGDAILWRMVSSWPRNLPGPGMTADRLAKRITVMSRGRLKIRLYAAGELVPALQAFDAVSVGTAEMAHTASFFWAGKMPAAAYFTATPFGLTPTEHQAWIYHGGGQALWDELYGAFGIKPFMAGNTGGSMGGWFKREIHSLEDMKGLKYRMPGLGGEVVHRLGATPVLLPPSEILPGLQSGLIDGAEFLGPWSDLALGFHKVAPYYYTPGFHEPNGTGECLISRKAWDGLPEDLQEVIRAACAAEDTYSLAETEWNNAVALKTLTEKHRISVRTFPADLLAAARIEATEVMLDFSRRGGLDKRIYQSYEAARKRAIDWAAISATPFINSRIG